MKRTDIPVRELLGYKRGEHGSLKPVIVLDTETLWTQSRTGGFGSRDGNRLFRRSSDNRYSDSNYGFGGAGILTLGVSRFIGTEDHADGAVSLLRELVAAMPQHLTEDAVNEWCAEKHEGVRLDLVNNRWILGPWAEVKREHEAEKEQKIRKHMAENEARERHSATVNSIRETLDRRSIKHGAMTVWGSNTRMEIDTMAVVALLNCIHELERKTD